MNIVKCKQAFEGKVLECPIQLPKNKNIIKKKKATKIDTEIGHFRPVPGVSRKERIKCKIY